MYRVAVHTADYPSSITLLSPGCQLQVMTLEQALAAQVAGQQAAAGGRGGASSSRGSGGAAAAAAATVTLAPAIMEASLNRMFEGEELWGGGVPA